MESSAQEVHENLNSVVDYQTHHRLRETQVSYTYISVRHEKSYILNKGRINIFSFYP